MTTDDRQLWDHRYAAKQTDRRVELPAHFVPFAEVLSSADCGIEIACGEGQATVWLARHGVVMDGFDISTVALTRARELADESGVGDLCRFEVADLDVGLPAGQPVDLVLCNLFRDPRLDDEIIHRLRPGGVLAIAALSEVGAEPGRFRVAAGALVEAFDRLTLVDSAEADGLAWLVATK